MTGCCVVFSPMHILIAVFLLKFFEIGFHVVKGDLELLPFLPSPTEC